MCTLHMMSSPISYGCETVKFPRVEAEADSHLIFEGVVVEMLERTCHLRR